MDQDEHDSKKQTIVELQQQIRSRARASAEAVRRTGCSGLDALFPNQGVQPGSLVEWIGTSGAGTVSLLVGQACRANLPFVLIDRHKHIFPSALAALGCDLSQLTFVRPRSERDTLWAMEEALRCQGVGLVWAEIEQLNSTSFRRLQLAAEESANVGFLVRSLKALRQSSWAQTRLTVQPRFARQESAPRTASFRVEVVAGHRRPLCSVVNLSIDCLRGTIYEVNAANPLSVVS